MDTVFSFLISVGIAAFGVWVVAGTIAAGSPLAWTFMGLLAVIVGLISLYGSVRDAKTASEFRFRLIRRSLADLIRPRALRCASSRSRSRNPRRGKTQTNGGTAHGAD
jgi:hypothetical protein